MKKLIFFLGLLAASASVIAQNPQIFNPKAKATVTAEQLDMYRQSTPSTTPGVTVLTFEGAGDYGTVGNYYNGGAGGNYGISFSSNSLSLISSVGGGSGNFCGNPSPYTCLFFITGSGAIMNVSGGFTTGFSFYYCSSQQITITVWDGLDGTGNVLATQSFSTNYMTDCTCSSGTFCNWDPVGVAFTGTAQSVTFGGAQNQCGFDDITLGSSDPGGSLDKAGPITGPDKVCPNSTGLVYSTPPVTNATGYVWRLPAGATITSGAGTTSITVNFGTASGDVAVYGTSSSANGPEATLLVHVYDPLEVGSISGDQTICHNGIPDELIGDPPTGGALPYIYQWQSSSDNITFTDIPGATALNYQPGPLTSTMYYRQIQTSTAGCQQLTTNTITITGDIIKPEITAVSDDQMIYAGRQCEAELPDYRGSVVATDNCDTQLSITQDPAPGTMISGAINLITLRATDDAGNFAEATLNVEVYDNTAPTISSWPDNQLLEPNQQGLAILPDYTGQVVATDYCCANLSYTQTPVAGGLFAGTQEVRIQVRDCVGNCSMIIFNVSVRDDIAPTIISYPPDQFLDADVICKAILPDYTGQVEASDLGDDELEVTQSPAPGSKVSGDTNAITLTVTDDAGNASQVMINVAVVDVTSPTIDCAGDFSVETKDPNGYTVVGTQFDPVSWFDNCDVSQISNDFNQSASLDGALLPEGINTITWTAYDQAGNSGSCTSEINVVSTVGIQWFEQKGYSIYPNPTDGKVYLEFPSNSKRLLKVLDISGRTFVETNLTGKTGILDLSNYLDGIYFITVIDKDNVVTTRIIKR